MAQIYLSLMVCIGLVSCQSRSLHDSNLALIGGSPANSVQFPGAFFVHRSCTAARVSTKHILLAAHCLYSAPGEFNSYLYEPRGVLSLAWGIDIEYHFNATTVQTYVHDSYKKQQEKSAFEFKALMDNPMHKIPVQLQDLAPLPGVTDLAIIEFEETSEMFEMLGHKHVKIETSSISTDDTLIAIGYGCEGDTKEALRQPTRLKFALFSPFRIWDDSFSAHENAGFGGCKGDSGGPVWRERVIKDASGKEISAKVVVGVNSYRDSDPEIRTVFMRLDGKAKEWLRKILPKASFSPE